MSLSSSATAAANPWLLVLESLEKKINKHSYDTWLKPTRFSHAKGKVLFISVPTAVSGGLDRHRRSNRAAARAPAVERLTRVVECMSTPSMLPASTST